MTARIQIFALLLSGIFLVQCALPEKPELKTDEQRTLYAFGAKVGENFRKGEIDLSKEEVSIFLLGLEDALNQENYRVVLETYEPKIQEFLEKKHTSAVEKRETSNKEFLEKTAKEEGYTKTESGILMKTLTAGTGASPTATQDVKVHYHGTFTDGSVFDSSVSRGEPVDLNLSRVIPCWTETAPKMQVGGKYKIVCPTETGYAQQGHPLEGKILIFEVELLELLGTSQSEAPAPK